MTLLDEPLDRRLGTKTARALQRALGVRTGRELLDHYPRRYVTRGELTPIDRLYPGEQATLVAQVVETTTRPMRARRGSLLEVLIGDGHGELTLTFFNQPWRAAELTPGTRGMFAGRIGEYRQQLQLTHPDYQLFQDDDEVDPDLWATRPLPVYPATAALPSWRIAKSIGILLDEVVPADIPDPVPEPRREAEGLLALAAAYEQIHRPLDSGQWRAARRTLAFTEALVLQTSLVRSRARLQARRTRPRPRRENGLLAEFDRASPLTPTPGQLQVGDEIAADLQRPIPMNRLLQGDVGSGKTLVALRAMLQVAEDGGQSALLAPTEVLAAQHFQTISRLLGPDLLARLAPVLVTGSLSTAERRSARLRVVSGRSRLVIGTHALMSEGTEFDDLGLVIVDEQHRFGVTQREALRRSAPGTPHMLLMTATPIPRTLAMTVLGDLDVSTLRDRPGGRAAVSTFVVPADERPAWYERVWSRLVEEVSAEHQAFIVCGRIDEATAGTGAAERASVEAMAKFLAGRRDTAHLRCGVLHGRLDAAEKRDLMQRFSEGRLDVLIATTVVEVGVDVPNATLMIVMDADRFGVSQLHQLRGRIGRGELPGTALLVTRAPAGTPARARVDAVASTSDGFELAELDLEQRSEGDVLGDEQSGRGSLRLLRVGRAEDQRLIVRARAVAEAVLAEDPELERHESLRALIDASLSTREAAHLRQG